MTRILYPVSYAYSVLKLPYAFVFFFQAEDGIRDIGVTGVQTCALPIFIDLVMAVVRRSLRGRSPFAPDKMHLHHRLLSIGHSHRRAVLVMYFSAALLSFGAVALSITGGRAELLVAIGVLLVVGVVVVLSPRARRAAREARAAELMAQKERSRLAHPTAR